MEQSYESIFPERQIIYAGFWQRFGAAFLDSIIVLIPGYIVNYLLKAPIGGLLIAWLYSALMESGNGQATFGKRAVGLKVTDMNGERISFGRATGRHFGKILSGLILLIGYLMMLWDDRKQTLHDKMAGTLVVVA